MFYVEIKSPGAGQVAMEWDPRKPVAIGPGRSWQLSAREEGFELRGPGQVARFEDQMEMPDGTELSIRPKPQLRPVYFPSEAIGSGELRVYRRIGEIPAGCHEVTGEFRANAGDKVAFTLRRSGDVAILRAYTPGILLSAGSTRSALAGDSELELSLQELTQCTLAYDEFRWNFFAPEAIQPAFSLRMSSDSTEKRFHRTLTGSALAVSALALLSLLWPAKTLPPVPPEPELVKLEIPKEKVQAWRVARAKPQVVAKGGAGPRNPTHAAPVFEGKELKSAARGLFRGGMTRLLAKSDVSIGDAEGQARKLFDGKTSNVHSTSPVVGLTSLKEVKVATFGGNGGAKGGVGYGSGTGAAVPGQGKALVRVDESETWVDEGLSREEVGRVIHGHLSEVRYCYESALVRSGEVEGKLMMGFTIGAPGNVKTARVRESSVGDSGLNDCISRRLSQWKFPKPKGGVEVAVTYPFIFKSLGR